MAEGARRAAERAARVGRNLIAIRTHLQECIEIASRGEEAFFGPDFVNRYAAYAALIQIGNAVKDLPDAFRDAHPTVGWRALLRTHDKVGHIYGDSIDWTIIWMTIVHDAPADLAALPASP